MAYVPRASASTNTPGKTTGRYIPRVSRKTDDSQSGSRFTDFIARPSLKVANSTSPTPTGADTADLAKGFGQGVGRQYLATGQALSAPLFGATREEMLSTPLVQQNEDTFLGQLTRNLSGTDKPISLAQEDKDLLGEDYGAASGGKLSVAFAGLDLLGGAGGGVKGLLRTAKTAQEASKVMRAAGFAEDIVTQYAPIFAKLKDEKKIEEGLIAAQKLQNTTTKTLPTPPGLPPINPNTLPTQATTVGRQTKQVIKANTEAPVKVVTKTEPILLKKQLRDQARGAKTGYKAGYLEAKESITNQLRTTFGTKIEKLKTEARGAVRGAKLQTKDKFEIRMSEANRASELARLKINMVTRDADRVRSAIVDFVKLTIPVAERGKFITTVKNAKTQKDLIQAFTRIDATANKIMLNDAVKGLKESTAKLSDSSSVAADYRSKITDIVSQYELTGHTDATIAKLEATQAYLNRAEAAGEDVSIPRRVLDRLEILSRTPKDKLTLAQVQRMQSEIDLLETLGKTKQRTKEAVYDIEKNRKKAELLNEGSPMNSKTGPERGIGDKPKVWVKKGMNVLNYFQKTRLGIRPVDGFAEITGMTPMKASLDTNFSEYLSREVPGVSRFRELEDKMLGLGESLTPASRERVGVYGHAKQTDGYEKLANLGYTRAQVDAVQLTDEEMAFYEAIQEFNKESFPAVKKYSNDVYNVDVGEVDNYMSYITDFDTMSDLDLYQRFGATAGDEVSRRTKTVEQGFTKERTGAGNQKVQLDALKIAQRHADDVAYMLTMGKDIKQYAEIVASPEMLQKLGDVGTLGWLQYLDLMARKGGIDSAKRLAALDIARKKLSAGVLSGRLSSALVQLTSFTDTLGTIGAEAATRGATAIATSKEWRSFVMDNFPEIRAAIGDDIAFREFDDSFLDRMTKLGFKPLVAIDGVMRSSAAAGAYEMLARKAGIAVDFKNPDKALIQEATRLTRQSQGSSIFKDQPLALTTGMGTLGNRSLNRLIYTFQSFALNRWDNIERQVWRMGIKEGKYGKAAMSFFWMVLVAAAMEESIRRVTRAVTDAVTGKEREEEDFIAAAALNIPQNVPLLGSIISSMNYGSNPVPVINTTEDFLDGLNSAFTGKADETKLRGAVRAVGAASSLSGVPGSSQVSQLIRDAIPEANGGSTSSDSPSTPSGLPKLPGQIKTLPTPTGLPKLPGS